MDVGKLPPGRPMHRHNDRTTLSHHTEGCTLAMYTTSWNARQRARLAELNLPSLEDDKLAAMICFKNLNYVPTIRKELRDNLMRLMVFIITTKGATKNTETTEEVNLAKLQVKIDVRILNHFLKSTLRGVQTCAGSEVDDQSAEVILTFWGGNEFEKVVWAVAKHYVLRTDGGPHAYLDFVDPEELAEEVVLSGGQVYHLSTSGHLA